MKNIYLTHEKQNETYKQDFLLSKSSSTIKSIIGEESFKCLPVILDINSPLTLIKYRVSVSSQTPRISCASDQAPQVNVTLLLPDCRPHKLKQLL